MFTGISIKCSKCDEVLVISKDPEKKVNYTKKPSAVLIDGNGLICKNCWSKLKK